MVPRLRRIELSAEMVYGPVLKTSCACAKEQDDE